MRLGRSLAATITTETATPVQHTMFKRPMVFFQLTDPLPVGSQAYPRLELSRD